MRVLRPSVLLLAAIVASPALYAALVDGSLPLDQALVRFLAAVAFCAVGCALIRSLVASTGPRPGEVAEPPRRRRSDDAGSSARALEARD